MKFFWKVIRSTVQPRLRMSLKVGLLPFLLSMAANAQSTGTISISGTEQQTIVPATSATGTITITGSEGTHNICTGGPTGPHGAPGIPVCHTYPDTGTLTIYVGPSFSATATYGSGSTDSSVALAVANALSVSGSPVSASSSGSVVTLTTFATGPSADISFSVTNSADFDGNDSGSTLSGGVAAQSAYDSGLVTVNVLGISAQVPWGLGSTAQSIQNQLANLLQSSAPGVLNVSISGTSINLSSIQPGNSSLSCSVSFDSAQFSSSSYSTACNGMNASSSSGPTITSVWPSSGTPGESPITIYGYGFTNTAGTLLFAGQPISTASWSDTEITFQVPANAVTSPLLVQVGSANSNGVLFTIGAALSCPAI